MNINLRKLNNLTSDTLKLIEIDRQTNADIDPKAYLELIELTTLMDRLISSLLSDIDSKRTLN
jgi:hypothetical protein